MYMHPENCSFTLFKKMATSYEPWKAPSASNLNFLDQTSSVNPGEGSVPPFRGAAPNTELGVHGSFDSPEETAQTSPATVTMACPVSMANWDATIKKIQSLRQRIVMVRSEPSEQSVMIEEPFRAERAYAKEGEVNSYFPEKVISSDIEKSIAVQAIALTGSRGAGDTLLVSLFPTGPNVNNRLFEMKETSYKGKTMFPNVGVLMSHIAEKSAGIIHITLAVEHAVETKLKRKNTYTDQERDKRNKITGRALTPSEMECFVTGHVTAGEPLLFKWFADK